MHRITAWRVQPSASGMAIVGKDSTDQVLRIAHVCSIEAAAPYPVATDVNGMQYLLVCDGAAVLPSLAPTDVANAVAA